MDQLTNLIKTLEPDQKEFIPEYKFDNIEVQTTQNSLIDVLKNPLQSMISHWKHQYKWPETEASMLSISPNGRKNSLYSSLLCLVHPKYNLACTHMQRIEIIDNFVRMVISKMELETRIKIFLHDLKLRPNFLIDEIKNDQYQSPAVVYYLSLVLDLNIIVLSSNEIELYYCEETYDNCKPHVLLYKDSSQTYYPIVSGTLNEKQLLIYHNSDLIKNLINNYSKKVICKNNYLKGTNQHKKVPVWTDNKTSYKAETALELRKVAESKGIDTRKISEITGKRIYKTKSELLADIEHFSSSQ